MRLCRPNATHDSAKIEWLSLADTPQAWELPQRTKDEDSCLVEIHHSYERPNMQNSRDRWKQNPHHQGLQQPAPYSQDWVGHLPAFLIFAPCCHLRTNESMLECSSLSHVRLSATPCSPPGSSVHGIFQARTLEWVAISFSRASHRPQKLNPGLLHCRQILY